MTRFLVVRHRVKDYEAWKRVFDAHEEFRMEYGLKGGEICRDLEDPEEVTVVLECEDLERAREFTKSEELRNAMREAGVVARPDFIFMEEVAKVSAPDPAEFASTGEGWCDCC